MSVMSRPATTLPRYSFREDVWCFRRSIAQEIEVLIEQMKVDAAFGRMNGC